MIKDILKYYFGNNDPVRMDEAAADLEAHFEKYIDALKAFVARAEHQMKHQDYDLLPEYEQAVTLLDELKKSRT